MKEKGAEAEEGRGLIKNLSLWDQDLAGLWLMVRIGRLNWGAGKKKCVGGVMDVNDGLSCM